MKTWSPDTCGCQIEEIYSGGSITGPGQVIRKCAAHASILDADLYGVLLTNPDGENRRKNRLEKMLIETSSLQLGQLNASGVFEWRPGLGFSWVWTGEGSGRVLRVTVIGVNLTAARKATAQAFCDATFGVGKVIV